MHSVNESINGINKDMHWMKIDIFSANKVGNGLIKKYVLGKYIKVCTGTR
jgi:hypothetical protein